MTENQLVSDIRNIATSGSNPDDFRISDDQIRYWIYQTMSMLKAQDIKKRKEISNVWVQTISCLDLEQVDKSECCEISTGCKILRSAVLPKTIETDNDTAILRVSDMMGNTISRTNYMEAVYNSYSKYGSKKPRWFPKNDRVYIINSNFLSKINIDLLAENPSDLAAYTSCSGSTCYSPDSEFPCSLAMASDITNIVLKTKVYPFLQLPQDNSNNSNNEPDQPINSKIR